jgi:hypothetical protein
VSLRSEFRVVMLVRFQLKHDARFIFPSSCLQEGSCLIYGICVYLRIMVSMHIVLCFSLSMLPVSLDCPFLIVPSAFSNIYS